MSGKQPDLTTSWSEWQWNSEGTFKYSTRLGPRGEVEYDYLETQAMPRYNTQSADWVSASGVDGTSTTSPFEYTTAPGPGYGSAGPALNQVTPSETDEVPLLRVEHPQSGDVVMSRHLQSNRSRSNVLDNTSFIQISLSDKKFWRPGRVFMMLWTEPARAGGMGTQHSTVWLNGRVFSEIRRFVVLGEGYGNVVCSPIHTYDNQATLKLNLPDVQQHAMIHTAPTPPQYHYRYDPATGETIYEQLSKAPIRVRSELDNDPDGDLGNLSRINYAKIYTVEKDMQIKNIGRVHENSMETLLSCSFFARPADEPPKGPSRPSHSSSKGHRRSDGHGRDSHTHSSSSGHHRRNH